MKSKLLIIGPDIEKHGMGGVTVHVRRLRDYLEKQGINYVFKDYKSNGLKTLLNTISDAEVVHFHVSNPIYQYVLVLSGRLMGKKVLMTLHGNYGRFGWFKNLLVRRAVSLATVPIVINERSFVACERFNKKTRLIPAFIPPQKEDSLPQTILTLLEKLHGEGKKIVSTNASNLAFDKDGNDIYGIDFLVQYFKDSNEMSLVVSDPSGTYRKKYMDLHSDSVVFIDYQHPYYELLKHVDYFVRNTSTDGDALSVKEALYLGVPALCTDAVDRPKGVRLFKYCDKKSFEQAMKMVCQNEFSVENGAEKIVEIYNNMR